MCAANSSALPASSSTIKQSAPWPAKPVTIASAHGCCALVIKTALLSNRIVSDALVSCLRNSLTKSSDTGENLISGFGPDKGLEIVVSEFDILFDGLFQFQRAAMSRSFDLSFGEQTKPPFH